MSGLLKELAELIEQAGEQHQQQFSEQYRVRFSPVIFTLAERKKCTVLELASLLNVTQPAITQTIKLMVNAGYVATKIDKTDKRKRTLRLTVKGKELLPLLEQNELRLTHALDSLEQDIGFSLTDALIIALDSLGQKSLGERITELGAIET